MNMFKNMLWMAGGVGVGVLATKYSKSMKKMVKKCKNDVCNMKADIMDCDN